MEDPWHNWHIHEKASRTEAAAVAQWQDQQHPLCPVASVMVPEPHPAELKLLVGPEGDITAVETETLEHTIRDRVVVVVVVVVIIF